MLEGRFVSVRSEYASVKLSRWIVLVRVDLAVLDFVVLYCRRKMYTRSELHTSLADFSVLRPGYDCLPF